MKRSLTILTFLCSLTAFSEDPPPNTPPRFFQTIAKHLNTEEYGPHRGAHPHESNFRAYGVFEAAHGLTRHHHSIYERSKNIITKKFSHSYSSEIICLCAYESQFPAEEAEIVPGIFARVQSTEKLGTSVHVRVGNFDRGDLDIRYSGNSDKAQAIIRNMMLASKIRKSETLKGVESSPLSVINAILKMLPESSRIDLPVADEEDIMVNQLYSDLYL